ncbi:MAG: hypothetical protein LKE28_08750 [Sphaerochaeta sp.]|nr:hypothetical protein [Sphaerochaeta sp.]
MGIRGCRPILSQSRESHAKETAYLDTIQDQIDEIGRQQYLLVVAIKETFRSFSDLHDQIQELLLNGNKRKAEDLYYDEFVPCASYLSSYTQQLLIQAITDNQAFYSALMRRNTLLSQIRNLFPGHRHGIRHHSGHLPAGHAPANPGTEQTVP